MVTPTNQYQRQPENTNLFRPTNYRLVFPQKTNTTFFCQRANIPGMTLTSAQIATPFVKIPEPGTKCDEEFRAYEEIFNWMVGMGYPENFNQRADFEDASLLNADDDPDRSDAILHILSNNMNPILAIKYIGCYPVTLSEIALDSTIPNPGDGISFDVTFDYMYYKFERP